MQHKEMQRIKAARLEEEVVEIEHAIEEQEEAKGRYAMFSLLTCNRSPSTLAH